MLTALENPGISADDFVSSVTGNALERGVDIKYLGRGVRDYNGFVGLLDGHGHAGLLFLGLDAFGQFPECGNAKFAALESGNPRAAFNDHPSAVFSEQLNLVGSLEFLAHVLGDQFPELGRDKFRNGFADDFGQVVSEKLGQLRVSVHQYALVGNADRFE